MLFWIAELTPKLLNALPPTDSRFRPDQRALVSVICSGSPELSILNLFLILSDGAFNLFCSQAYRCTTWLSFSQEDGNLEKATPEKLRLEEKQRSARRVRKEKGIEWQNMWFTQVPSKLLWLTPRVSKIRITAQNITFYVIKVSILELPLVVLFVFHLLGKMLMLLKYWSSMCWLMIESMKRIGDYKMKLYSIKRHPFMTSSLFKVDLRCVFQRDPGVSEVKSIEIENSEPSWVYKGTYWDARDQRAWENCPDIM